MPFKFSRLTIALLLAFTASALRADDSQVITALRAADDERVAAILAVAPERLNAILSDQLHYAHSSGKIDTKPSFIAALTARQVIYESVNYSRRDFRLVAPGVALMSGQAKVNVRNGAQPMELDLCYLAVWREENGRWRFLAWQSTKVPPPAATPSAEIAPKTVPR